MFKQQKTILETAPKLKDILAQYQWQTTPTDWLDTAEQESRHFVVTLPFVGAFSAGKSTLINTLLGETLLSTNIDPETAYPTELSYGPSEKLTGNLPDGTEIPLTRNDLLHNLNTLLPKNSYVSITLPHPLLAKLPHLRLVDMPGWDSGIEAHTNAIDNYAARSLAYCVVVSADEGNLRESQRRALQELAVREMPILTVISKADKKLPEDVDAVMEQVRQEVTTAMKRPPLAVARASRKECNELIEALTRFEQQAERLFAQNVSRNVVIKLGSFNAHLETLINSDDLDSEKIQAECDRLNSDMANFQTRLEDETRQLETRVQPVLGRIMGRIETALRTDLEFLTDEALSGSDLSGSIGSTIRLAAQEGFAADFNPEIARYLERVVDGLPEGFSPEINTTFDYRADSEDGDKPQTLVFTPLLTTLSPLLKFVPGKLQFLVPIVIGIVGIIETLFVSQKKKEADEARQQESVRKKIASTVIPDALRQVKSVLQPMLEEHIRTAKQQIANTVQAQRASHEAALRELQTKLTEGQTAFAATRTRYQADHDTVSRLITELEQA